MKRLYFLATSLMVVASAFAQEDDPYWYIRGSFNEYNPNGAQEWALMDDDEGDQGVYTGTFTIDAGAFSFNLMSDQGMIFVPAGADGDGESTNVTFTDNVFKGSLTTAYDPTEESYYWTVSDWEGGQITVSVDAQEGLIEIYAFPKQAVGSEDLYTITPYDEGIIKITWEDYMVAPSGNNAYVLASDGTQIPLKRAPQVDDVYQITVSGYDVIPGVITVDLNNLELEEGDYSLVIGEGYVDVISEDYDEYWESNPEISVSFTIGEGTEVDPYWYIRGTFNNYNPNGAQEWALMDDDEGEEGVYTGTFTVDAGSFSFNLITGQGMIFVPLGADGEGEPTTVTFTNNVYEGTLAPAWDETEDGYYWTVSEWEGGQITVSVNTQEGFIEIYAIPKQAVGSDDLYTITPYDQGIIKITWKDYMIWPSGTTAYVLSADGTQTPLKRAPQVDDVYQITLSADDAIPGVITIDLNNLDLAAGKYTLVIGEGYVDVISEDYEYWESNPEITYEFTVTTSGVKSLSIVKDADIYSIQGMKISNKDLNTLSNGIYIIGGKKVIIKN